ncbi:MAG: septal ring lytic transglycosylase RlpA family protein [Ferruginibacter sp.]
MQIFKTLAVFAAVVITLFLFNSDAFAQTKEEVKKIVAKHSTKNIKTLYGQASFYSAKFEGRKTASGQKFSHKKFTAACNSLPLGTYIKVTNLRNGKSVVVQTNDRLHKNTKRLVDLTMSAAKKLDFISTGLTRVKVEILGKRN